LIPLSVGCSTIEVVREIGISPSSVRLLIDFFESELSNVAA